jgi:hypothetical protein
MQHAATHFIGGVRVSVCALRTEGPSLERVASCGVDSRQ